MLSIRVAVSCNTFFFRFLLIVSYPSLVVFLLLLLRDVSPYYRGTARAIFRIVTILSAHPDQRVEQDDIDFPKDLSKVLGIEDAVAVEVPLGVGAWPALSSQQEKPREPTKNVSSGSSLWMRGGINGKKGRKGAVNNSEEDKKNIADSNPS